MNVQRYVAELVGTYILVVVGSLAIVSSLAAETAVLAVVPFGFGLGLLAAIFAVGHVSGGHFNPAVTLGALLDRRIEPIDAAAYVVAQVVGAIAASLTILVVAGQPAVVDTRTVPGVDELAAAAVEAVLTAVFLLVILVVTRRHPDPAPFAISLTLAVIHFAGIPLSGASVNPARSLGPAIVGADLGPIWIYIVAPLVGAAIGWAIYRYVEPPRASRTDQPAG